MNQPLAAAQGTLAAALFPASSRSSALARNVTLAFFGSLLLWASAKVHIPFYPVPMTMQTYMVLVLGAAYGWRLGFATVLLYLAEGALGLPVFSGTPEKGIGLAYMMGPTGGYLAGFAVAAGLVGWFAQKGFDRSILAMGAVMLAGHAVVYVLGVGYLTSLIGFDKAIQFGLLPFVYGDVLKVVLAAVTLPAAWSLLRRR